MPREFIHWGVVERVFDRLRVEAPNLENLLKDGLPAAKAGAIAHDIPYFLPGDTEGFDAIAAVLHGASGEDTFEPLRNFSSLIQRQTPRADQGRLWAFLVGMVSHVVTDSRFHPFVYYWTGDYNHPDPEERSRARTRHRLFEVQMDLSFIEPQSSKAIPPFASIYSELPASERNEICILLASSVPAPTLHARRRVPLNQKWMRGFKKYSRDQRLFHSHLAGAGIRLLHQLAGNRGRELDSLFSHGRKSLEMFRAGKISYRNPVSGDESLDNLDSLFEKSVNDSVSLLCALEPFVSGEASVNDIPWPKFRGPSLSFGLPQTSAKDAKFFANS